MKIYQRIEWISGMLLDQYLSAEKFYTIYPDGKEIDSLTQGDIIRGEDSKKVHVVVTNACDLEIRNGKRKADFIHTILLKPVTDRAFLG